MKEYEDPNMDPMDLDGRLKSGFDVHSNDDETGPGFGPLIG